MFFPLDQRRILWRCGELKGSSSPSLCNSNKLLMICWVTLAWSRSWDYLSWSSFCFDTWARLTPGQVCVCSFLMKGFGFCNIHLSLRSEAKKWTQVSICPCGVPASPWSVHSISALASWLWSWRYQAPATDTDIICISLFEPWKIQSQVSEA